MSQEKPESRLATIKERISSELVANELLAALPPHISVEKFQRVVLTAISKKPDLAEANLQSLLTSCVECAQDGLLPDGKQAALVVYNTNTAPKKAPKIWVQKVQYMPMITGIYKLAFNSGEVAFLDAHEIFQNDVFNHELGLHPKLEHRPTIGERGKRIGAYAVARLSNGEEYVEVMSLSEIEAIRLESSKSKDKDSGAPYGPWKTYYGEMARKTVMRRLSKRLPLSSDLSRVIERMDDTHSFDNKTDNVAGATPPRPAPKDYENNNAVEMFTLIDEFGESVGEFSSEAYVDETVKRINAFTMSDLFDAFMEYNADAIESLGTRSDERKEISEALNAARERLAQPPEESTPDAGDGDAAGPEVSADINWETWCKEFRDTLNIVPSVASLNRMLEHQKVEFGQLQNAHPIWHKELFDLVNAKAAEFDYKGET